MLRSVSAKMINNYLINKKSTTLFFKFQQNSEIFIQIINETKEIIAELEGYATKKKKQAQTIEHILATSVQRFGFNSRVMNILLMAEIKTVGTYIPLYNEIQSKLFLGNTRLSSVAYSIFLGIKDVSNSLQRRIKDLRERP